MVDMTAKRLKEVRKKLLLTQQDFSKLIFTSQQNLSLLENGHHQIHSDIAERVNNLSDRFDLVMED